MAESNTYVGVISSVQDRDTYQKLTSTQKYSTKVRYACFNKTTFTKAIGVEAFGPDAMLDVNRFGVTESNGRIVQYDQGVYALSDQIFATASSSTHVGRLGSFTGSLTEGGSQMGYSWHRLIAAEMVPDVDVQDNSKGQIDILAQKLGRMEKSYVRDFNYCLLGHSSAPNAGVLGPSSVYSDLPNLISVTQTRTVGGIATTNSFWKNGYKAIATIGGGGELDRPLILRRSLKDQMNDQHTYAEATLDYLFVCTQGAWQYMDRLMYADTIQGRNGGAMGGIKKYDAAGILHYAFEGQPMVWDPALTVPYGATASTESIYGIHVPSYFLSLRKEESFKVDGWEKPRVHDQYRTLNAQIRTRYTPGVSDRRTHFVAYNMPACPD